MAEHSIPTRADVPAADKWDLSTLFKTNDDWETALARIPALTDALIAFKGKLGDSAQSLLGALKALEELERTVELTAQYASLLYAADLGDAAAQEREGRVTMAVTQADSAASFFFPELMAIDETSIRTWMQDAAFDDYRVYLAKRLRMKPHILSEKEERLLALQAESAQTAHKTFSLLNNTDLQFGTVRADGKDEPLTHSTYALFMENPDRAVRREAYTKFYAAFAQHQNTIASLYAGSVAQDVFEARARGYASSLDAALFGDKVPPSVYRNLIDTVHQNLPALHRYYALRKKTLGLAELRHYDVYVPLVPRVETRTGYEAAVEICRSALAPLGTDYTDILCDGLLHGWADRYENKGKRSGAFSAGAYTGYPYILLNYKDSSIRDVFTMIHEGGHSMHSHYSKTSNPFMSYDYTIFEAEVASTFNEELLFEYLLKNAADRPMRAYLLAMRANDILATLHRQTMFAEFELKAHELMESGTPLSAQVLRETYRGLLEQYFGSDMVFEPESDLEGLRIPHFYNAFYVYKYSTGISAALALAKRVTQGGQAERDDYFAFLKSGGSRYPIESLRAAGVDMESTAPTQSALDTFAAIVDELETLL
ncbi:MAG: oligoendopeptidase F [Treponema sp.]|nr:oligoendopeptidase F [Treponema sp.]